MSNEKNGIQKIAIVIIVIGFIVAIICGCVLKTIPADYLTNNLSDPALYPLDVAPRVFGWAIFFTVTASSALCGFLFYCLGTIIQRQENIFFELKAAREAVLNKSQVGQPDKPSGANEPIRSDKSNADSAPTKSSHRWKDDNGNWVYE